MTAAKLAANRANAQRSTGPADTTQTRFNSVKHGLTGKQAVLPGESQEAYDGLRAGFLADLKPRSTIEHFLAERIIAAAWRLLRLQRMETALYRDRINTFLSEQPGADPDEALAALWVDPAEANRMRLMQRYQTAAQREFDKAIAEFRKARQQQETEDIALAAIRHAIEDEPAALIQSELKIPDSGFVSHGAQQPCTGAVPAPALAATAAARPLAP